jgi:hypothetical protein
MAKEGDTAMDVSLASDGAVGPGADRVDRLTPRTASRNRYHRGRSARISAVVRPLYAP